VNLVGDNIDAINRNTGTIINAIYEVGLEVNTEKTKCMLVSRHQNSSQNQGVQVVNRSFEYVSQFKYLGTVVTNQNFLWLEMGVKKRKKRGLII
jgi:hypothetical protein